MYTLNVKPYRILIDELLANWVEGEADEDEDDDDDDDDDDKVSLLQQHLHTLGVLIT